MVKCSNFRVFRDIRTLPMAHLCKDQAHLPEPEVILTPRPSSSTIPLITTKQKTSRLSSFNGGPQAVTPHCSACVLRRRHVRLRVVYSYYNIRKRLSHIVLVLGNIWSNRFRGYNKIIKQMATAVLEGNELEERRRKNGRKGAGRMDEKAQEGRTTFSIFAELEI
ncbi:hypothetical protein DINM_006214 [Dirofilaria immitis]|nr:hypothetical protein [Dirofilaria immitis]